MTDAAPLTEPGGLGRGRRPARTATRVVIAAGSALAIAAGVGYAAELGPFDPGPPIPAPEATKQARAFLADWEAGRIARAAALTSRPEEAERVLKSFTAGLDISEPTLTPGAATAGEDGTVTMAFSARMPVTDLGTWTYASSLPLRKQDDGTWKVDWALSLVHPKLSGTHKFRLEREDSALPQINDRDGNALSGTTHPSLGPLIPRIAGGSGAGPRGAVRLVERATGEVTGTEVSFGKKSERPADKPVATTLDATWQSAAEKALAAEAEGKDAALVALRVDDGEILAVANSPSAGFNRAVSGTYAPGSTWKIVTTSALLLKDAVAPGDVVDCPKYLTVGKRFQNVEASEHRDATFRKDFSASCNTAFIGLRDKVSDRELGDVPGKYFGVGQEWNVGIPSYDGSVPVPRDQTEKAASMIGQGRVQANPLIMASVTATAVSGTFHQPTLTGAAEDTTTTTPLPREVVAQLRELMRATVTEGTASVLADLPGSVGAKTGTAEVSEDAPNNGWFVAHRGNVAVACVVEKGVTGGASAGPVVRSLLGAVPDDPS
ncbi:penicillin-binding protein [Streptomyces longisporoflavus]|uniref:penicillin-binding transpeptidase domain-containing protein n=1 Tax=Streptomyces longisporoflavus TaxID=28044 RepID=UPI00167DF67A|nr:penicillin-binding transpeptidase domain-containing protein [Streptomyces longisporoflavus]GGV23522.1 penicillin-binding protein [Streptomyces longisporoflavus]